jgi:hypothetical protein
MRAAKQIVFRHNGDTGTEEIDLDMDGDKSVPEQGSVVERKRSALRLVFYGICLGRRPPKPDVPYLHAWSANRRCDRS